MRLVAAWMLQLLRAAVSYHSVIGGSEVSLM